MPGTLASFIATTYTDGILCGLYIVTAGYANRWLLFTDEGWTLRKNVQWLTFIVTNLIFAMVIANAVVCIEGEMREMNFIEQGTALADYARPPWEAIVKCTLADSIALLADTVLMYRVWLTHGRSMRVMYFPIFLWVAGFVCTVLQLFLQVIHIHNPNFGPYNWANVNMSVGPGIVLIPFWASTILLNAYCTGALLIRIWKATKEGENSTLSKQLQFIIRVLIESGALYLSISLAHFVAWFGHSDFAILILGTMNLIIIGIAYNLIIIRTSYSRVETEELSYGVGRLTTMAFTSKPAMEISVDYTTSVDNHSNIYRRTPEESSREGSCKAAERYD